MRAAVFWAIEKVYNDAWRGGGGHASVGGLGAGESVMAADAANVGATTTAIIHPQYAEFADR